MLVTPPTRREFRDGKLRNTLASWSDQVRGVAKAMDVPLVDLNALSAAQAQEMGAEMATKLAQEPPADRGTRGGEGGHDDFPRARPRPNPRRSLATARAGR